MQQRGLLWGILASAVAGVFCGWFFGQESSATSCGMTGGPPELGSGGQRLTGAALAPPDVYPLIPSLWLPDPDYRLP